LSKISSIDGNVYSNIDLDIIDRKVKIPVDVEFLDKVVFNNTVLEETRGDKVLHKDQYFINYGYIYVHEDNIGVLNLFYYTVPLSDDGSPSIPDNDYYKSAILAFLKFKIGERAYWQKKILERQYLMLEQEWNFYIKATQANNKSNFFKDPNRFRRIAKRFY